MELWDLYDKNRKPLGKLHKRSEQIPWGEYHIVVSVLTLNSKGEVLTTLRSGNKQHCPAFWELTTGSAIAGETAREAALRELYEETGISATDNELTYLDTYIGINSHSFVDMFMIKKDIEIPDIKLQKGETDDAKWVTKEQFEQMIADGIVTPPVARRWSLMKKLGVLDQ